MARFRPVPLMIALGLQAQGPAYVEAARSVFEMKGQVFSHVSLEVDPGALRRAVAHPSVSSEDPLHRALRGMREGRVRFRIRQGWEVDVSGAQRRTFNERVEIGRAHV